jgi:K+-transporting ATPase ATPase C chain
MWKQFLPAFRMLLLMTVLTGLLYPALVTGICLGLFPGKAGGSLVTHDGLPVGSALLGQNFSRPEYFHPRPSAAGPNGYDPTASGGSNLGPTSRKLAERVSSTVSGLHTSEPAFHGEWPADLATASGSGLDPHISPASAEVQVARVAQARGIQPDAVRTVVALFTEGRDLGFLGEPRVNVLRLNLALDEHFGARH